MTRPEGSLPGVERGWTTASAYEEDLPRGYRYAVWDPTDDTPGYAVVESLHAAGMASRSSLYNDILACDRFGDTDFGHRLLPQLGIATSAPRKTPVTNYHVAEMRYRGINQTARSIHTLNGRLPADHQLGLVRTDSKPQQSALDIVTVLAEEEPVLLVADKGIYGIHDRGAHIGAWEALSPKTRYAIRDVARATLAGEIPADPNYPGGGGAISQLADRLDFNITLRRITPGVLQQPAPGAGRAHILPLALASVLRISREEAQVYANDTLDHVRYLTDWLTIQMLGSATVRSHIQE